MYEAKPKTRIFALLFDMAIVYAISLLVMFRPIVAMIDAFLSRTNGNIFSLFLSAMLAGGIVMIVMIIYFLVLPVYWKGQTIGKRFFKIRVVKTDGGDVTFQTLFLREVIGRILIVIMSFGLSSLADVATLLISESHKTFHDTLAFTKVVNVE